MIYINLYIGKVQRTPNKMNTKKTTAIQIRVKLWKLKIKRKSKKQPEENYIQRNNGQNNS